MDSFDSFGLKPALMSALHAMRFEKPTEVQAAAIPEILKKKDVFVRAKTGTGKTAAFLVPILQMITPSKVPQAIIIVPTRELAVQIDGVARKLSSTLRLNVTTVYGGVSLRPQMESLSRGTDILVGTPGRIIDLMERQSLDLSRARFLVLDEADLMLDMGFIEDIEYIISTMPEQRQTMLFSATAPVGIQKIADRHMNSPVHLSIGADDELVVTSIKNMYAEVDKFGKFSTLLAYTKLQKTGRTMIFARTQDTAEILHRILRDAHMDPILLHGGMTQAKRNFSMKLFKENKNGIMIATNVAARGLDISDVNDIVNFDPPDDPVVYVHRVGRSARMGKDGKAFTIFTHEQTRLVNEIESYSGIRMEKISVNTDEFKNINFGKYIRSRFGPPRNDRGPRHDQRHGPHHQHGGYRPRGGRPGHYGPRN